MWSILWFVGGKQHVQGDKASTVRRADWSSGVHLGCSSLELLGWTQYEASSGYNGSLSGDP